MNDFRRLFQRLELVISQIGSLLLNMLRAPRRWLMPLLLLAVSARVFTGAAEAQVSFTSLVSDITASQKISFQQSDSDTYPQIRSAERANPIPDKQRNSVTYKKYLTPENSTAVLMPTASRINKTPEFISYQLVIYKASPVWVLRANAPPKASLVATPSHTLKTYSFISWESEFGTSTINNGAGGISSI